MKLLSSDYRFLEALVSQKVGLKVDQGRYDQVARILETMLDATGLTSVQALLVALSERQPTDALWRELVNTITIGETYFFRDAAQCNALQSEVLPELIASQRAAGFHHLSLWSAGCATGEEPYTLAIMLRELIPDIADWTFTILGTDINLTSLETARQATYKARSFREETRGDIQARWFTARGNSYELDPAVRKMVEFAPLNLVSDDYPSFESLTMNLDLIICRNVTIYFEAAATGQIIQRFHRALNDDGWLVTGHAEPLALVYPGFRPCNFTNAVLYQKQPERPTSVTPVQTAHPVVLPAIVQATPVPSEECDARVKPDPLQEAQIAAGREDWEAAQRWLAIAERKDPVNPKVHYLRGLMLMYRGQLDGALRALRRALYCDSAFTLAHYALGELYEKRGNYQEARRCWLRSQRTVAGRKPDDYLAAGEDLTVEMLTDLLNYRLSNLPDGG